MRMSEVKRRYQIFISSTYKDLVEEREAVLKAILKSYHFPIGMEMFHADDQEQWVQIANTIEMSDFYILIVGNCCGTLIEGTGISYTEREYDYARSIGVPVLAFVIDPLTKSTHYEETPRQRRVYKKFREKIDKLPRELWKNKDDLSLKVITALHAKIAENKRKGWVPYNPTSMVSMNDITSEIVGTYSAVYYSALSVTNERYVKSELTIDSYGNATFCNNTECKGSSPYEFIYHGFCEDAGSLFYIYLKNDYSGERAMIQFIKPVGNLERFIGLFMACSVNNTPVCVKVACYKSHLKQSISRDILDRILLKKNAQYQDSAYIIEDNEKLLFYSDYLFQDILETEGANDD
jgi:hypothetical protein